MKTLLDDSAVCDSLLDRFGSPVHVHSSEPMARNVGDLIRVATEHDVSLDVFFARKANKALIYVETAYEMGIGVDVASLEELDQVLSSGFPPTRVIVTAAIKSSELMRRCARDDILVVLDNRDEADAFIDMCDAEREIGRVAIRVGGHILGHQAAPSRFGFEPAEIVPLVAELTPRASADIQVEGLHFHLDGYEVFDRVDALNTCLGLVDELATRGHQMEYIDMGGGFPMQYAASPAEWHDFWRTLSRSMLGDQAPVTYRNMGYGQIAHEGRVLGPREAYPHVQPMDASAWLSAILAAPLEPGNATTVAEALTKRGLRLRCEPGRALLDGCGVTLARIQHLKSLDDDLMIGLDMNGSNCRSRKSELLTDPVFIGHQRANPDTVTGYLTGAYCTESDLITHRRLAIPKEIDTGDAVAFVNTAGYLMHFVESRSHQLPLPTNAVLGPDGSARIDACDSTANDLV